MKKLLIYGTLGLCTLCGVGHAVDLILFTDGATGFVTIGNVWVRYGLLLPVVLLCFAAPLCLPPLAAHAPRESRLGNMLLSIIGFFLCLTVIWQVLDMFTTTGPVSLRHISSPLLLVYALWLLFGFVQRDAQSTPSSGFILWGAAGTLVFCLLAVERFVAQPSSLHRIAPVVHTFSAVAAMLFSAALVQALHYTRLGAAPSRKLCSTGLLCFLLCTCLGLPQAVANVYANGDFSALFLAVSLGFMGIYGAYQAVAFTRFTPLPAAENTTSAEDAPPVTAVPPAAQDGLPVPPTGNENAPAAEGFPTGKGSV